jgi:major vault protein
VDRFPGDEYLFKGPGTYIPRIEEEIAVEFKDTIIKPNCALKLRAVRNTTDSEGNKRIVGEVWLIRKAGSYLPSENEEIVEIMKAQVLTDKQCIHLKAVQDFVDVYGIQRKAGQQWLIGIEKAETHICDVYEEIVGNVKIKSLNNRQYCYVVNPIGADGKRNFGITELRQGEMKFFLKPGEKLLSGI